MDLATVFECAEPHPELHDDCTSPFGEMKSDLSGNETRPFVCVCVCVCACACVCVCARLCGEREQQGTAQARRAKIREFRPRNSKTSSNFD